MKTPLSCFYNKLTGYDNLDRISHMEALMKKAILLSILFSIFVLVLVSCTNLEKVSSTFPSEKITTITENRKKPSEETTPVVSKIPIKPIKSPEAIPSASVKPSYKPTSTPTITPPSVITPSKTPLPIPTPTPMPKIKADEHVTKIYEDACQDITIGNYYDALSKLSEIKQYEAAENQIRYLTSIVDFSDDQIQKAAYGYASYENPILFEDSILFFQLEDISYIVVKNPNNDTQDLIDLQYMKNISSIEFERFNCINSEVLLTLPKLRSLHINNATNFSLDLVENLINLSGLKIKNAKLIDISKLSKLRKLSALYLDYNTIISLKGIEKMYQLRSFQASNNEITSISELSRFYKLETLNMNNNNIVDLSPLQDLIKLYSIKLRNNEINNIDSLGEILSLRYLDISNNNIEDISSLQKLEELRYLDISNNYILDTDENSQTFIDLLNQECEVIGYPHKITNVNQREQVYKRAMTLYANGQISKMLSLLDLIDDYKNASDLVTYFNETVVFEDKIFENIIRSQIKGSNGNIKGYQLEYIRTLYIDNKEINSIKGIQYAINLQSLTINCLEGSSLHNLSYLANLEKIIEIKITNAKIQNLSDLVNFKNLLRLDLSDNIIEDITAVSKLVVLNRLLLNNNSITDLYEVSFPNSLELLSLSSNNIESIPVKVITNVEKLELLAIKNTKIDNLDFVLNIPLLKALYCSHNHLLDISMLQHCENLTQLDFIECIIEDTYENNKTIRILEEKGCVITR